MSNVAEQNRVVALSEQDVFRLRMENQCYLIRKYRESMLCDSGRLMTPDEAALEWVQRFAATFDTDNPEN